MKKFALSLGAALIVTAAPALAHDPHEHGVAHLNLSVAEQKVEIEVKSALANFISFEHAPETEAQKKEVREMAAILNGADALFTFPPEAKCRLEHVELKSAVLADELPAAGDPSGQNGRAEKEAAHSEHEHDEHDGHEHDDHQEKGHGNIDVDISFVCANPSKLNSVDVGLFKRFPALNEIEVQMITPKGQGAAELNKEASLIKW